MAHDYSPDSCECCERTAKAWQGINQIAEALSLQRNWSCHTDIATIIEEIEDWQDLITRQRYVLGQIGRGKR